MNSIDQLNEQLNELRHQIASVDLFRPGTLSSHLRKCGNPHCQCAQPGGRKHPGWQLTRKVDGKSRCRSIPQSKLEEVRSQLKEHERFQSLIKQFTELNDALCDALLKTQRAEKKTSRPGTRNSR